MQKKSSTYIRSFPEIRAADVGIVGGKGANLGEMARAGLPVPPGFCLTAEAYRAFIRSAEAAETIRSILTATHFDDPTDVELKTDRIRNYLVEQPMPSDIAGQLIEGYRHLVHVLDNAVDSPVAVRSSATAEDLPTASFAGQQDTYLNIRGEDQLLAHVKRCWASLWTARAVTYRVKQGFEHEKVALAVVVQAMIEAESAGVLFTANPVSGERGEAVINSSWGLGEAIVSGTVTPDTWVVRKSHGAILSREIASKEIAVQYSPHGGTWQVNVDPELRTVPSLDDNQVILLAQLGDKIEDHYHAPMDVEWAYARGNLYLLQARAITTLSDQPVSKETGADYNRTMFIEIFPDPLSPIFLSVIQPMFHSMLDFTFNTLGFTPARRADAVGVFHNQPYFNRNYIAAAFEPLSPSVRERMVQQLVNPFGQHEKGLHGEFSWAYLRMMSRMMRFMIGFPALLQGILAEWHAKIKAEESVSVGSLSDREIADRVDRLVFSSASRLLNYDFMMIALIGITYRMLGSLLAPYFGSESEEISNKLISGVTGNVTMEANTHIWDLAQSAKRSPIVSAVLREFRGHDVREHLLQSEEGRTWLADFDRFLAQYGHREIRMDILYPTWGEEPMPVLAFVRSYLDLDETASPHRQQERLVLEREELARTVQKRVSKDWIGRLAVGPIFNWVLKNTQLHTRERDTMHFELTRMFPPFRRLLLELGGRWMERGFIAESSDIFYLTLGEAHELTKSPRAVFDKIKERRAEFEKSKERMAPGIIRDGKEIYSEGTDVAESTQNQLQGIAGSPGMVTGVARVIRGPEEFDKLQRGDILVAPITNPVWTPLFAIAGGIVTEVGGILSHGAIVAREYGIPAVMGVARATKSLSDGQRLTVNGSKGVVLLC